MYGQKIETFLYNAILEYEDHNVSVDRPYKPSMLGSMAPS